MWTNIISTLYWPVIHTNLSIFFCLPSSRLRKQPRMKSYHRRIPFQLKAPSAPAEWTNGMGNKIYTSDQVRWKKKLLKNTLMYFRWMKRPNGTHTIHNNSEWIRWVVRCVLCTTVANHQPNGLSRTITNKCRRMSQVHETNIEFGNRMTVFFRLRYECVSVQR